MKMSVKENGTVDLIENELMGLQEIKNDVIYEPVVEKIVIIENECNKVSCSSSNHFPIESGNVQQQQGPSVGGVINAPSFLTKTFDMVEEPTTNHLISWSSDGESFIVSDHNVFASELLPKYFRHNHFSSFIYQLNNYGFRKIEHDRWEYYHKCFRKGQPLLLESIKRRVSSCKKKEEAVKKMQAQISKLKIQNNNSLMELEKLKQQQDASEIYKRQVQETLDSTMKSFKTPLVDLIHELMDQMVKGKRGLDEEGECSNAKKAKLELETGGGMFSESFEKLLMDDGENEWAFRAMCESNDQYFDLESSRIYMEFQNVLGNEASGPGAGAGAGGEGPDGDYRA